MIVMSYEILDNFLAKEDLENIHNILLGEDFPWFYNDGITDEQLEDPFSYQFVHGFYKNYSWNSNYAGLVFPLVDKINPFALLRIKANLNPCAGKHVYGGWHRDYEQDCKTAVFYVNDNNGWTEFKTGERIESKANRLVIFDSYHLHSGVSATNVKARCLINFNFIPHSK